MIYCPKCGHQHEPQPIQYKLENEVEAFQNELAEYNNELEGYKKAGEGEDTVVSIHYAHIEAGPYNGDRYLMDYDVKACSCPKCNATFYIEE